MLFQRLHFVSQRPRRISKRRVFVHRDPHSADSDVLRAIDSQQVGCGGANFGQADQFGRGIVPAKMIGPVVTLGMEQADWLF